MASSKVECTTPGIPSRLHTADRPIVEKLDEDDLLYMRHPPREGESYGLAIPGHSNLEDQSVNSRDLGRPFGVPEDVLLNTEGGPHFLHYQIACFSVAEIVNLKLPNKNTMIRDADGNERPKDHFSFRIFHAPTPCMYPHCEIIAFKNDVQITGKINSSSMKTLIREEFAEIAERHRIKMQNSGFLSWLYEFMQSIPARIKRLCHSLVSY